MYTFSGSYSLSDSLVKLRQSQTTEAVPKPSLPIATCLFLEDLAEFYWVVVRCFVAAHCLSFCY
jgi:hypothetical protein